MTPLEFITILLGDKTMIPTAVHPSYAFFLLSLYNFQNAWHVWLGPALEHRGHYVCLFPQFLFLGDHPANRFSDCTYKPQELV